MGDGIAVLSAGSIFPLEACFGCVVVHDAGPVDLSKKLATPPTLV